MEANTFIIEANKKSSNKGTTSNLKNSGNDNKVGDGGGDSPTRRVAEKHGNVGSTRPKWRE
jgi:hypothetical protein